MDTTTKQHFINEKEFKASTNTLPKNRKIEVPTTTN